MSDHRHGDIYPDEFVREILDSVKTIALVGASANPNKPSHAVLKDLLSKGYQVLPVNPRPDVTEIAGLPVYDTLAAIDRSVDMVDVFRPANELAGLAREAVAIQARVLWGQLDIVDEQAAAIARAGGLQVVMDRCPSIELARTH
ncbi:IclR family transcriptional regulator [Spiribacter salinus M19-40]|jgi:predicted CoA-binding protein|uniref:IclR family transcriptional regulator n=2 Tax=Spiribacter salinus TaxID=1335746 RepID=R4VNH2_9GAMM|nr:CoA-binding protein [Spiribacter salinus]AGM41108.1 IclR family transcriptional regulator [Spiribacter salinus M19-40]MBY5268347.1 hypothetical protein [Spiribacter salinus]MDR9414175.1 CoA-binding protein [Spiribacter sp.]TQE99113.1 MAG: CoA-binding protein [Spiribacter salinus]